MPTDKANWQNED